MSSLGGDKNLPPKIMNEFLNNVINFEERWEKQKGKKLLKHSDFKISKST